MFLFEDCLLRTDLEVGNAGGLGAWRWGIVGVMFSLSGSSRGGGLGFERSVLGVGLSIILVVSGVVVVVGLLAVAVVATILTTAVMTTTSLYCYYDDHSHYHEHHCRHHHAE